MITHEFPPFSGGGGIMCFKVALELSKDHQVDVITPHYSKMKKTEEINGITIYRVKVFGKVNVESEKNKFLIVISFISFILSGIIKSFFLSINKKYHIINSYFLIPAGIIGTVTSFITKIPHIATVIEADIFNPMRNCQLPYQNSLLRYVISTIMKLSTEVVTISQYNKNAIERYYTKKKVVHVIYPGLEKIKYQPINREKLGFYNEDFILISIGRLVKRKGFKYLIEAMNFLKNDKIKLIIIGDGPELLNLRNLTKRLNLEQKIIFLGHQKNEKKYQYLSISDLFVSTTLHEGLGMVYLEAMYFGLPIVTTNEGGQIDLIIDGENGFLVPVGNVEKLIEKILLLYKDKNLCNKMKLNNLTKIKNFTIETAAEKYYHLFIHKLKHP